MDYSIKISGEAGQGIQTVGGTLARLFARAGYHVFTHQDYESRVRGGNNFEGISRYGNELSENGIIVYDSLSLKQKHEGPHFLDVPFVKLAVEHGGNKIMANTVATGSILGMLAMKLDMLNEIIRVTFRKKGEDMVKGNINAAAAGHEFAVRNCEQCSFDAGEGGRPPMPAKMLIAGNEAIGLGAIASGLKFYSAYPMTPSTGIMNYIAGKEKEHGIIVEQAEDEISAINMALGASFAGVRAMTGTSGGGFALMSEGLSLAGMTETPVVIALAQRPGPATGFPTRTEQSDLQFALYTAHGEFPRIIFAPGTPKQALYLTNKAFDLAEKYQIPVIIITDQYLADSQWAYEGLDLSGIKYTDYRLRGSEFENLSEYKRHAFTETGITPLGVPGDSRHLVVTDSDEHDEEGHIVEDAETRIKMLDKRLFKKSPLIREEIAPPVIYSNNQPDIVLVGWGSTYGIIREAVDMLSQANSIAMLHFSEIYPFPGIDKFDYLSILRNASISICIENNATGQFARLVRSETGYEFKVKINKYDGRPFTLDSLLGELNAFIG
jgi:2-oxoglutarate ferredoxin oxidoreductase subunit alpha